MTGTISEDERSSATLSSLHELSIDTMSTYKNDGVFPAVVDLQPDVFSRGNLRPGRVVKVSGRAGDMFVPSGFEDPERHDAALLMLCQLSMSRVTRNEEGGWKRHVRSDRGCCGVWALGDLDCDCLLPSLKSWSAPSFLPQTALLKSEIGPAAPAVSGLVNAEGGPLNRITESGVQRHRPLAL